jgi:hypothetical protein
MRLHHLRKPLKVALRPPAIPHPPSVPHADDPLLTMNPPHRTPAQPRHTQCARPYRPLTLGPRLHPHLLTRPRTDTALRPRRQRALQIRHRTPTSHSHEPLGRRPQAHLLELRIRRRQ